MVPWHHFVTFKDLALQGTTFKPRVTPRALPVYGFTVLYDACSMWLAATHETPCACAPGVPGRVRAVCPRPFKIRYPLLKIQVKIAWQLVGPTS